MRRSTRIRIRIQRRAAPRIRVHPIREQYSVHCILYCAFEERPLLCSSVLYSRLDVRTPECWWARAAAAAAHRTAGGALRPERPRMSCRRRARRQWSGRSARRTRRTAPRVARSGAARAPPNAAWAPASCWCPASAASVRATYTAAPPHPNRSINHLI